jgi:hypothetical protein
MIHYTHNCKSKQVYSKYMYVVLLLATIYKKAVKFNIVYGSYYMIVVSQILVLVASTFLYYIYMYVVCRL